MAVAGSPFRQQTYSLSCGNGAAIESMALTRVELADQLLALDEELHRLEVNGAQEETVQLLLEHMVNASTRTVGQQDRLWWWKQLYSVMDRHAARPMPTPVATTSK